MVKKVLIVDDNKDIRDLIKDILMDFDVEIAENGLVALEKFKEKRHDIILMDLVMPEMNGTEATRKIIEMGQIPLS